MVAEYNAAMEQYCGIIDEIDKRILAIMQSDARTPNVALARAVGLAPSAVLARVRRLERDGLIRGYSARLDRAALGWSVCAFVRVRTDEPVRRPTVASALARISQILEVHDVAGEDCYIAKVVARDMTDLHALVRLQIGAIPHVRGTSTTLILKTFKETANIPTPEASPGRRSRRRKR